MLPDRDVIDEGFAAYIRERGEHQLRVAVLQLQEEPDHIGVWPDQAAHQERGHRTPNS